MGVGQSAVTGSQPPTRALHVLRVTPSSPASQANIEAFFDFIVGFDGDSSLSRKAIDAAELERIVESHESKSYRPYLLYTSVVPITPSREWSILGSAPAHPGESDSDRQPSLLGLSMRMCEPVFAVNNVWHVLDVLEGSPAESAGLVPYGDWIIGWSGGVLSAEGDFYDVVEAHVDKPLRVYVYSYDFDTIREVVLVPNRQWGGEGLLGCVFGFGLLHRIPAVPRDREPGALPPELVEHSNEYEEQQLFVPADSSSERFDFEVVSAYDQHELRSADYAPPADSDYSYTYNNRGASYQSRTHREFIIPEDPEDYESNGHAYDDDGHGHTHDHGHTHNHDHTHDHGHFHNFDEERRRSSISSNDSDHGPTASTPRPHLGHSQPSRGFFPNGLHYTSIGGRPSLSETSLRFGGSRTSPQDATGYSTGTQHEDDYDEYDDAMEKSAISEVVSDHGSLTSVE